MASYDDMGQLLQASEVYGLSVQPSGSGTIDIVALALTTTSEQNTVITHGVVAKHQMQCCGRHARL